ncbi:MAG TPA: class I SAM-dependent methyltransferase [Anaerolineae bacterium]|nr:class I SAM-dependent methyltransferase [Anaerolineae bacterium]
MVRDIVALNRRKIERDLRDSPRRRYFSAILLGQYRVTVPLIQKYATGALIDLGCGVMPYRSFIEDHVSRYDSLDPRPQLPGITYQADIQAMAQILDATYDSAICLEVLEHVPEPFKAMAEIYRILKPGGILIVSVPHLSRLHEEPYDFFRFTRYGLMSLFQTAGFEVVQIVLRGGLFSFLSHQVSTITLGLTWSIPLVRTVVFFLNEWLCVRPSYFLDAHLDRSGIFALGYTCVVRKPQEDR